MKSQKEQDRYREKESKIFRGVFGKDNKNKFEGISFKKRGKK